VEWIDDQRATSRFKLRFSLGSDSKRASGVAKVFVTVRMHPAGSEIVGIRERREKD
jgi:hypothetical protein